MIVGQRPYSRREVARLVAEARALLDAPDGGTGGDAGRPPLPDARRERLSHVLSRLERDHAPSSSGDGFRGRADGFAATATLLDSPGRPIADVGLGAITATVNPLAQNIGGRSLVHGLTGWGEAATSASLGRHVAGNAHGRVTLQSARSGGSDATLDVHALSATLGAHNVVVQVGRQQPSYGQGMHGGLFLSRNAPGLDMVRIGNDIPARLPGFLGRLGPARGTLFVADLGSGQHFAHEKLAGWKVSFLPVPRLELGMSLLTQQGGAGAPPATWSERVIDVVTIVDVLFIQDRDLIFSNKLAGLDMRLRLQSSELYAEVMSDDFDVRRVGSSLWEDTGYLVGVVLPALGRSGAWRFDAEYQHTGLRFYQHGQFRSGVTSRGTILGVPLGPRGDGGVARLRWDGGLASDAWLAVAGERRSDDQYVTAYGENDSGFRFVRTEDRPEEYRTRLVAGASRRVAGGAARLEAEGGVEHVRAHRFILGESRVGSMARLAFIIGF